MKKIFAALLVSAGLVAPAHASFVITGGATILTSAVNENDFQAELQAAGYTNFTTSFTLSVNNDGEFSIYKVGSESNDENSLRSSGGIITAETDTSGVFHYGVGLTGLLVGSSFQTAAALNPVLASYFFNVDVAAAAGSQNAALPSVGFGVFWNPANLDDIILAFDDHGANPEDNHDDLLVRLTTTSAVAEPATWALMILGFAGLAFARRRLAKTA